MEISKQTLEIFKNFSEINNSIYLDEPEYIKTKTPNSSNVIGIAKISETLPEIAIYSLDEFLGSISLMSDNVEYDFTKDYIKIKDGKAKIKYRLSDPSHILNQCKAVQDYEAFDSFDCSFNLSEEQLSSIKKASRVLGANVMEINLEDGKGTINLINSEMPMSNSFEIQIKGSGTGEGKVYVENLKMINTDYNIMVASNKVIKFIKEKDFELFYFVACAIL
jgi:hypothetical protein